MIEDKIKNVDELISIVSRLKKNGKKIITTNGVFDIMHPGHVKYLEKAKKLGDILIVGVNSDASVKENKGDRRPINDQKSRSEVVAALESIDFVIIFGEKDPRKWLDKIKPDIHIKAGDYKKEQIIESSIVEKNKGRVVILEFKEGHSTTKTINKIIGLYKS